jgi:uncharacterized protein (TIGR03000 family)
MAPARPGVFRGPSQALGRRNILPRNRSRPPAGFVAGAPTSKGAVVVKRVYMAAFVLGCLFALAAPAHAGLFRPGPPFRPITPPLRPATPPMRPDIDPNRMPGWDWWRIYPWSPYNYGRNPYNPIIIPYPYPYPYPPLYGPSDDGAPDGAMFPSSVGQQIVIPHPTGEVKVPPPGAAIILVRVPDENARVLFDGERTYTVGTKRYFVTPELDDGKTSHYTVSASWKDGDQRVNKEQEIKVSPGHTTVVDFRGQGGK